VAATYWWSARRIAYFGGVSRFNAFAESIAVDAAAWGNAAACM
jgi:hypothetical protein